MRKRPASLLIIGILITSGLSVVINISPVSAIDWLDDFSYRISHNITGSSTAGNNYQINLTIHSGGDSENNEGSVCYLENNCNNFPDDIRFTSDDGVTELDYWIEDEETDPIRVWIEVTDDLSNGNTVLIFVYCGKEGVSSNSSINDTFLWFYDPSIGDDPANLTVDADAGTKWIHVSDVSAFNTGEQIQIHDLSDEGTASPPVTYGETIGNGENITIQTVHEGNNSLYITDVLSNTYTVENNSCISHWYYHWQNSLDGGNADRSRMWYWENYDIDQTGIRSFTLVEFANPYGLGDFSSTGFGFDDRLVFSPYDDSNGTFVRWSTSPGYATSDHPTYQLYTYNGGFHDSCTIIWNTSYADTMTIGEKQLQSYYILDGSKCDIACYNYSDFSDVDYANATEDIPDDITYPFIRIHIGNTAPSLTGDWEFYHIDDKLYIYCQEPQGSPPELALYVHWWVVAKYVSPEPIHGDWGGEVDETGDYFDKMNFGVYANIPPENNSPIISDPHPPNGATGISTSLGEWNCTINDPEGDIFDWTIEISNSNNSSGDDASNGTKNCELGELENNTLYTIYVNITGGTWDEGYGPENKTYSFRTINPEDISSTTGIMDYGIIISVMIFFLVIGVFASLLQITKGVK